VKKHGIAPVAYGVAKLAVRYPSGEGKKSRSILDHPAPGNPRGGKSQILGAQSQDCISIFF